jgi:hypothetical protein
MNDDQIRNLFHEMRDDPVPADSLARVRQAVMARASARGAGRGFGLIWKLAIPVALAGCIAAVLLRPSVRRVAPPAVQPVTLIDEPAPVLPPQPPGLHKHPRATVKAARHLQAKPAPQEAGASVIRIETSDPGVVILLLADGGSGSSRRPIARE